MFDGFAATVTITEIAAITQVIANHCARDDEVAGDDSHANTQILMTLMTMMMRRMTVIATRYKKYKQHRRSSGASSSSSSSRWWRRRRKRNDNNKNVNSNQILEVIVVEVIIGTAGVVAVVAAVVAIVVVLVFFSGSSGGSRSGSGSSSSSRNTRDLNSKELEITIVCLGHTLVSNGIIIHSRCTVLIAEAPVLTWETPRPGCTKHQVRCARTFQQPGNTKHPERSQT